MLGLITVVSYVIKCKDFGSQPGTLVNSIQSLSFNIQVASLQTFSRTSSSAGVAKDFSATSLAHQLPALNHFF